MVENEATYENDQRSKWPKVQAQLERLHANRQKWSKLSDKKKLTYLEGILNRLTKLSHDEWGNKSAKAQGLDIQAEFGAEVAAMDGLVNVIITTGLIRSLIRTYKSLSKSGKPPSMGKATNTAKGWKARVFPIDMKDKMSPNGMAGITVEIHGKGNEKDLQFTPSKTPRLCLTLGAGNQSFLAFGDVITKMFIEGQICVLKHHPVRSFSKPFYDEIFQELIQDGYFWSTNGDIEFSQWLCHNPCIDTIHMTGGVSTHDAIVWGEGKETQKQNKSKNTPVLNKNMTSELSCITPWIICPGTTWTKSELNHQAAVLAQAFVSQNSCNCLAPKVLVVDEDWPQKSEFLDILRGMLNAAPLLPPYYPGTNLRYAKFQQEYPDREEILAAKAPTPKNTSFEKAKPWMLLHLKEGSNRYGLEKEAFAPILSVWSLSTQNDAKRFLKSAVEFVNESIVGTLSCTMIIHDNIGKNCRLEIEEAIANLQYGVIALNSWTATAYGIGAGSWGAYPGETVDNVTSGIGVVGNTLMLKNIEKTVLRSPFKHSAQLALKKGRLPFTTDQLESLKQLTLKPSISSAAKFIKLMAFSGR